jgi:hypothetical protein
VKPEEVRDTVMAMRNDAYLAMTGKDAPPLASEVVAGVIADTERVRQDLLRSQPVKLGERVHFDYSDILRRQSVTPYDIKQPMRKEWRKTQWGKRGDLRHGLIIGVRTLSNGTITWFSDEPIVFHPEMYFTAYLIAYDLRRNPVYLLPDDVTRQA